MVHSYSSCRAAWRGGKRAALLALALGAGLPSWAQPCTLTPTITAAGSTTLCGGGSVSLSVGGIGAGGYALTSIPYAPLASVNPTTGPTGDDAVANNVPLGFSFTFYGNTYTECTVSTNGNVQFVGAGTGSTAYTPTTLPDPANPNNLVALCWTDLDFRTTGTLTYETIGTQPSRKFIVRYEDVEHYNSPGTFTGQMVLYEGSNVIELHVFQETNDVKFHTMGIENSDGTSGLMPPNRDRGQWTITAPEAWRFTPDNGQFTYSWSPTTGLSNPTSATTTASPTVTTTYTLTVSNAQGCTGTAQTTITVSAGPTITSTTPGSRCGTGSVELRASGAAPGVQYAWYTTATGGTPVQAPAASPIFTTPPISVTTTYYVGLIRGGCAGPRVAVVATVTPAPAPTLSAAGSTTICAGGSVALTAAGGGAGASYQFLLNGQPISGATSATYQATQAGTYTVTATAGACSGVSPTPVTITVNPQATVAFAYPSSTLCLSGPNPVPTVTGASGGTFSSTTGLTLNATTGQINLTTSRAGSYTVTYTIGGACPATATQLVTLTTAPVATFSYPVVGAACAGASAMLMPTMAPGASGGLFSSTTGLTIDAQTGAINLATSVAGTYTVRNTIAASGSCAAATATTSVTITAAPTATLTAGGPTTFCVGDSVQITAASGGAGATYQFLLNGQPISGATSSTYRATQAGAYTVRVTSAVGCQATSAPLTVVINPLESAAFAYAATTLCLSASNPLPTVTGASGGTFSSSAPGLGLNAATGAIDLAASTAGTYTVTYTTAGPCPATATQTITLTAVPSALFSYVPAGPACAGIAGVLTPTVAPNATAGTFSSTAGLTIDPATGAIDLASSTAGTYTVTNTVGASGGCAGDLAATTVTISASPTAALTASGTTTICAGDSLQLTASGGVSYQFLLNGQPISGATSATYQATQAGTYAVKVTNAAGCDATSASITVTLVAPPSPPTVTQTQLSSGQVQLTAAGSGTIQWYYNGAAIPGATGTTYVVSTSAQSGVYTAVSTSATTTCSSAPSTPLTVTVLATARDLAAALTFALVPNPTADGRVTATLTGTTTTWTLRVFDATGRVVEKIEMAAGQSSVELDWHALPVGVYAVRLTTPAGAALMRRLVRE